MLTEGAVILVMDERKKNVLHAIIQDYVETAEPVGSRTISRKYNLGVSSATIRNEMADLEDMGYIEQPHTSSGRIPSDKGYRYYVDFLMKKIDITPPEEQYIYSQLNSNIQLMEDMFKKTSDVLSQLTNYVAMTMGPIVSEATVQQIQLHKLSDNQILLVIISNEGIVDSGVFGFSSEIEKETLAVLSEILSHKLKGYKLKDINKTVLQEIYFELAEYRKLVSVVLEYVQEALKVSHRDKIYVGGILNILNQPEFKDVETLKGLLSLLEEQTVIRKVLQETSKESGLTISIGGENKHQGIHNCSIITATYKLDGKVVGTIGILGPTRMVYSKTATILEFVSDYLSDYFQGRR